MVDDTLKDTFVSTVSVLAPEAGDPAGHVRELHQVLSRSYTNYEIIVVDNGLDADALTGVRALLAELPCIRILRLTRHHTADRAIFAGLEAAIGEHVVVVTPGFDDVDLVPQIVELTMSGHDVVQGLSTSPLGGTWWGKFGRTFFYWYNRRYLRVDIPTRATYLTGLTRRAVTSLGNTARNQRYLRHLIGHLGFRVRSFSYDPRPGGAKRRTFKAGVVEAAEMISSYSTHPLRIITAVGVVAGLLNLAYAVYVVIINIVSADVAEGWTTTSLQLSAMFFLICTILAVQSEYIGRILVETRREPSYLILEELESDSLIADGNRRNISG